MQRSPEKFRGLLRERSGAMREESEISQLRVFVTMRSKARLALLWLVFAAIERRLRRSVFEGARSASMTDVRPAWARS